VTTFLLVRHALHAYGGERIAGRQTNVHLSPAGQEQTVGLATRLSSLPIRAVYTSPLERTRETAEAIAKPLNLTPQVRDELMELNFGDWTGERLDDLRPQEHWKQFNAFRSGTPAPNGELMLETQGRIVGLMTRLREAHPNETVALVSHADVIKSAVAYFLGVPIDLFLRIEISCASVSVVAVADYGPWVLGVNHTGDMPVLP